ncbi:MAG: integrase, partial [Lachnospiraceae bacterium]|nr:integrase [Lachnospiraceae bacterium]
MTGRPESDEWNIIDNDKESQYYGKNFRFDFSFITSETIKDVVKDYTWQNYKVGNIVLSTLYNYVNGDFYYFNNFANTRNITSLTELTNIDIDYF